MADSIAQIYVTDVQLSDEQIKTLAANPIELVPAPGSGLALIFSMAYYYLDTAAGTYTRNSSSDVVIKIGDIAVDKSLESVEALSLHTASARAFWGSAGWGSDVVVPANSAMSLVNDGGEYTAGNPANTLSVRVYYMIAPAIPFVHPSSQG